MNVLQEIDIKLILAIIASVITIVAYVPYIKDIFAGKTKPHAYSWLIWAMTQGVATVAVVHGGGSFGAMSLAIGTLLVIFIFLLSLKYGTKDITKSDGLALIAAFLVIIIWWLFSSPYLAVIMVIIIDSIGFIPTLRKTFNDPMSETLSFWIAMVVVDILILTSNAEYNFLTMAYPIMLFILNFMVVILIINKTGKR